ncbi:MAG: InlB B-repeat-containing protein [Bacilli bacterium]|nr:InlB B-repeat-containing protein [Bacilli bacterium]
MRKMLVLTSLFLALFAIVKFGSEMSVSANGNENNYGDVNEDGVANTSDVIYMLYHVMFGKDGYPLYQGNKTEINGLTVGDFNGDKTVNTKDVTHLLYNVMFGDSSYPLYVESSEDNVAPEIILDGVTQNVNLNWNTTFDPLKGVKAIDNVDGDITSDIVVTHNIDNKTYGTYDVKYTVSDKAGNKTEYVRKVTVMWNYGVEFIGHAGSYYGLMNSEEAILYAIKNLKYQAVEVDLKQTKDGVFVLCHDDTFAGYTIASTNWSELKDVTRTAPRSGGIPSQNGSVTKDSYTTGLCTLERFLEICRDNNVKAVIELKYSNGINNNDQSRMQALMNMIENYNMRENTILLASQYKCLIWTRENGYDDIECQYLVNSCESETTLNRCKEYNFTVSINTTGNYSNSDEWLAKYQEAGLKISTYTYTQWVDYNVVQSWIDKGVDYVTCDWHLMDQLELPVNSGDEVKTYTVTFKDHDGTVLKTATVKEGRTAAAPSDPQRLGYEFAGWDKSINNVREDYEVYATYNLVTYTITYVNTLNTLVESEWASKDAFAQEFYSDFFNWLVSKAGVLPDITKTGDTYKIVKNGVTVTFTNVSDILGSDIYVFEKTFSNYIYKPVTRTSDGTCVIEASEDYFLNSDAYRDKYKEVDTMLYRCIKNRYTGYDATYTPTSAGKIQIFFRFHQWIKGTTINEFLPLPKKYTSTGSNTDIVLPTNPITYTILDEIVLPNPTSSLEFLGWYSNADFTGSKIEKIENGTTGNIVLYGKWNE